MSGTFSSPSEFKQALEIAVGACSNGESSAVDMVLMTGSLRPSTTVTNGPGVTVEETQVSLTEDGDSTPSSSFESCCSSPSRPS